MAATQIALDNIKQWRRDISDKLAEAANLQRKSLVEMRNVLLAHGYVKGAKLREISTGKLAVVVEAVNTGSDFKARFYLENGRLERTFNGTIFLDAYNPVTDRFRFQDFEVIKK
jgi:hypothetical protein